MIEWEWVIKSWDNVKLQIIAESFIYCGITINLTDPRINQRIFDNNVILQNFRDVLEREQ